MRRPELRCVFVTIPPLLSAIIAEALSRRVELRQLAELDQRGGLEERLVQLSPDLVVMGLSAGESDEIGSSLLTHIPRAQVLLIGGAGDYAYLYEMRPHRDVLFDFSPDNLLTALFGANGPVLTAPPPAEG